MLTLMLAALEPILQLMHTEGATRLRLHVGSRGPPLFLLSRSRPRSCLTPTTPCSRSMVRDPTSTLRRTGWSTTRRSMPTLPRASPGS